MESIAIIGTGISAMGAAYFLKDKYDIVFYEKNDYAGGHTHTLTVDEDGDQIPIDSAFMVYNEITYPNLTRLFKELDVKVKNTDMSFSVQHEVSGLEFCGTGLSGLFAQRKNLFNLNHWKLLLEMDRFNKHAPGILNKEEYYSYSVKDYVNEEGYSVDFVEKFLVPISSAVWSTPHDLMLDFPIVTLVQFFKNHGFLGLNGHYQWKTVVNGSQQYRDKILNHFKDCMYLENAVTKVKRKKGLVEVTDCHGVTTVFDKVILASHADQSLEMLEDASDFEKELLSCFPYQDNRVTLHTDESIMPKARGAWSSWNYVVGREHAFTVYWMNNLQHVSKNKNYFISVNDPFAIDPSKILWDSHYAHPIFNVDGIRRQNELHQLNDKGPVYFCGAYFKYGFHEDGLTSGISVAEKILGEKVWN